MILPFDNNKLVDMISIEILLYDGMHDTNGAYNKEFMRIMRTVWPLLHVKFLSGTSFFIIAFVIYYLLYFIKSLFTQKDSSGKDKFRLEHEITVHFRYTDTIYTYDEFLKLFGYSNTDKFRAVMIEFLQNYSESDLIIDTVDELYRKTHSVDYFTASELCFFEKVNCYTKIYDNLFPPVVKE
jgi:hypothetical protein